MTEYFIIAAFAFWFAELSSLPQLAMHWINFLLFVITGDHNIVTRLMPFDCVKCLGFWTGFSYALIFQYNLLWAIIIGGFISCLSMTMNYVYKRIKSDFI